jgi:hypothetical protein
MYLELASHSHCLTEVDLIFGNSYRLESRLTFFFLQIGCYYCSLQMMLTNLKGSLVVWSLNDSKSCYFYCFDMICC